MKQANDELNVFYSLFIGAAAWAVPGAGHLLLKEYRRGILMLAGIVGLFAMGLYIGSVGVINPIEARLWYYAQMLTSPAVALIGKLNMPVDGMVPYPSYGKPYEIGQIYTFTAGALNLLCIVHAMYIAYTGKLQPEQAQ
jgi:hypothetical protein